MARPIGGYKNAAAKRIPGTTTITGRFKDSGGLIHWAWQTGIDGADYRAVRDKAADSGTLAHALVEAHLTNTDISDTLESADPETLEQAQQGFESWKLWLQQTASEVISWEQPLVSEEYQYGGTPDCLIKSNGTGQWALGDWKSGGVYSDALLQLAAYQQLFRETHPELSLEPGCHIVRFSRQSGDFSHHYFSVLDDAWRMFLLFREAYELDKQIKKRLR